MKKINKMVLNQIAKKELTIKQLGFIKGGRARSCSCGCCYYPTEPDADYGSSGCTLYHRGESSYCYNSRTVKCSG